ncbi:MAG: hypothetical protein ACM3ZE_22845, partial [Myxococcales bacterium]
YTCSISSAPNKCCDGVGNSGVCQLDTLGVPRCNGLGTTCRVAGDQCASADDCCDNAPCVRDPQGILRCYGAGQCVDHGGSCTINADCCPGSVCVHQQGSTTGACGTPVTPGSGTGGAAGFGGAPNIPAAGNAGAVGTTRIVPPPICAEYGQMCTSAANCCNGVPCTSGTCMFPLL